MKLAELDFAVVATPIGSFILAAREDGLKGGWFIGQRYFPRISAAKGWTERATPVLSEAATQLSDYFARKRESFDLPLAPDGTPFQRAVWEALVAVPFGETTSYAAIARGLGRPRASHPVGAAVARNPISILIPCHRALGSDGSLTGYAGGLERKRWLLDHESPAGNLFHQTQQTLGA